MQPEDSQYHYPFSAVCGQDTFKLALMLAAVNPLVGGVLVSGPRGSAKSTLARGLADILPQTTQSNSQAPFVTLPLAATDEMLVGTLDLAKVLNEKEVRFRPGLIAKAHQGVLYVDEVNLLPDNLVDQLLDVATTGVNVVERDGISHSHPANFILLGTMNPDEGELRPQLTDRFGLSVQLDNQYSLEQRVEIVTLREEFDKDRAVFVERFHQSQVQLASLLEKAKAKLPHVKANNSVRILIAERAMSANVDGLRADIVWLQAAIAHAALDGREEVNDQDVLAVEELVLNHRRQESDTPPPPNKPFSRPQSDNQDESSKKSSGEWGAMDAPSKSQNALKTKVDLPFTKITAPQTFSTPSEISANSKCLGEAKGLRQTHGVSQKVDWFKSLIANAGNWPINKLSFKNRRKGQRVINLVLMDTSASILHQQGFAKAKGVVLELANKAYLKRELFSIFGFGDKAARQLFSTKRAPKSIETFLNTIEASGGTPLNDAIVSLQKFQTQQARKFPDLYFRNLIITDGRVSQPMMSNKLLGDTVVLDVEQASVKRGKARQIAQSLGAEYVALAV